MDVHISTLKDYSVVQLHGRLDTITAADFEAKILPLIIPGARLLVDCSGMNYISSSGLRIFLMAYKKIAEAGGQLRLCCLQPNIREIFDISGFSRIFSIFDDPESATQ